MFFSYSIHSTESKHKNTLISLHQRTAAPARTPEPPLVSSCSFWHCHTALCSPLLLLRWHFHCRIKRITSFWKLENRLHLINTSQQGAVCLLKNNHAFQKIWVTWIHQECDDSSGETGRQKESRQANYRQSAGGVCSHQSKTHRAEQVANVIFYWSELSTCLSRNVLRHQAEFWLVYWSVGTLLHKRMHVWIKGLRFE